MTVVCSECGGDRVEYSIPAWFNANTHEQTGVDEGSEVMYTYCPDCCDGAGESRRGNWLTEVSQ